jgi:hypothetical protein
MQHQITTDAAWRGTHEERLDILYAIAHNCECEVDDMGAQLEACASHRMLISGQRALDGLLFARRIAERLKQQEFKLNDCGQRAWTPDYADLNMSQRRSPRSRRGAPAARGL